MTISEINIIPVKPDCGLVGFASCVLDGSYYIAGIAIFTRPQGGFRLVYPTRKIGNRHLQIHHPITQGMGCALEDAILHRAEEIFRVPLTTEVDQDGEMTAPSLP